MKTKLKFFCGVLSLFTGTAVFAQNANQNLSNLLSPTSVNQDLIPSTNGTLNLGNTATNTTSKKWLGLWLSEVNGAVNWANVAWRYSLGTSVGTHTLTWNS